MLDASCFDIDSPILRYDAVALRIAVRMLREAVPVTMYVSIDGYPLLRNCSEPLSAESTMMGILNHVVSVL